jgi:hypothetical protein
MSVKRLSLGILVALAVLLPSWVAPDAQEGRTPAAEGRPVAPLAGPTRSSSQGPELWISSPTVPTGHDRYRPAVAHDWVHSQFLVVWQNDWPQHKDIYARRVTEGSKLLSWFAITNPTAALPGNRQQPDVAYGAADAEWLVIWARDVDLDGWGDSIWGRFIAWDGSYQKPEFEIFKWPNRAFVAPRVVYNHNRNEFLVVWNAFDTTNNPPLPNDIAGRIVSADGSLGSVKVMVSGASVFPQQADLAYNWTTNQYLVVYVRAFTEVTTGDDIYALRLNWRADHLNPPHVFAISKRPVHEDAPRVAVSREGRYFVVWEHEQHAADHDIYGQELNADGTPTGFSVSIVPNYDDRWPDVAASYNGNSYLLTWQQDKRIMGWYARPPVQNWFEVAGAAFWEHAHPAVAPGRPHFLIAYEGLSGEPHKERHIYGRTSALHATFLPLMMRAWP